MNEAVINALVALFFMGLAWRMGRAYVRDQDARMLAEFREKFPGRCPVCSYHRYGRLNGYTSPTSTPDKHECIDIRRSA